MKTSEKSFLSRGKIAERRAVTTSRMTHSVFIINHGRAGTRLNNIITIEWRSYRAVIT